METVVALNYAVRQRDEWFDEPDDYDILTRCLATVAANARSVVDTAAQYAFAIAHYQAFGEGNKRTALLTARWMLDHNDFDGYHIIPPGDQALLDLLIRAAVGESVESEIITLFRQRS